MDSRIRAPHGESARVLAAVAAAIDHKLGSRKRKISGQLTGRAVTRATSRRVWLNASEYTVDVAANGDGSHGDATLVPEGSETTIKLRYRGSADTAKGKGELITVQSAWQPGEPVWSGTVGSDAVSVQVRAIPNGFHAGVARHVRERAGLYRAVRPVMRG